MLTLDEVRTKVASGDIDTILLGFADMQGRLMGKRMTADHFLADIAHKGANGCAYTLAVDVDMRTVEGFEMASWETGYGDFVMKPDLDTLRPIPWQEGTALVMADLKWEDGTDVIASPRQILAHQIDRLAERGLKATGATELEFMVFRDTYEEAWNKGYRDMRPVTRYNIDYALLDTAQVEPLIRRIRNEAAGAGLKVEDSKGECNFGQHEINFEYGPVMRTADEHIIYKNGAKEIAAQEGYSLTFMAKYDEREGSSCHLHLSLQSEDGTPVFAEDDKLFRHFLAGQLACLSELTLFYAPTINSYKRFASASFAPTTVSWGVDNRTTSLRVVGSGPAKRVENRLPGSDVNPYLALAAMIAAGLYGIENELEPEEATTGSAYEAGKPRVPLTLRHARDLFASSEIAREAFGEGVVKHYVNHADVEIDAFDAAVTDWERFRNFERL
jgi:glutamine synthetase